MQYTSSIIRTVSNHFTQVLCEFSTERSEPHGVYSPLPQHHPVLPAFLSVFQLPVVGVISVRELKKAIVTGSGITSFSTANDILKSLVNAKSSRF